MTDLTIPCFLRIGQKVVAVNLGKYPEFVALGLSVPVNGGIYTIRDIYPDPNYGVIGLRFAEIKNPIMKPPHPEMEVGFWHGEFQPLVTRETDISIFTQMLTPNKELVS